MRSIILIFLSGRLCDLSRQKRALGERNIMELVLSSERCGLVSSAMDDCKIASCKDDDRRKVNQNGQIPIGAICRIKCRSVKATRCRCCQAGFEIGKRCPEAGDEDSCELAVDENALYEGPNADLYPATDWRACYQECIDRGMDCHAASYVKLRFNSMCWIFNEITTRYGDDKPEQSDTFGGPTRELFGLRSGTHIGDSNSKKPPVITKPIINLPNEMQPIVITPVGRSGSTPFRQPLFGSTATNDATGIAKGDAAPQGANYVGEPIMRSWFRECLGNETN